LNKILPLLEENTPLIQIFKKSATFLLFVAFNFALNVENVDKIIFHFSSLLGVFLQKNVHKLNSAIFGKNDSSTAIKSSPLF
jgi:hypothetical protein